MTTLVSTGVFFMSNINSVIYAETLISIEFGGLIE